MNSLVNGLKSLYIRSSPVTSSSSSTTIVASAFRSSKQLLPVSTNHLVDQQRHRGSTIQRIKGAPRQPLPFKIQPRPHDFDFIPILPKDEEYTTKRLPIQKLAGRDPESGRVVVSTRGGGNKKYFRWVDFQRWAPENGSIQEKVYKVRQDPLHTYLIALVAREGHQRWIVASENMKPGDIITTHNHIPKVPIIGKEGDNWPVGALVPGSIVHHVEVIPGQGAVRCLIAGSHATILRRMKDKIVLKMPSKQEIAIDQHCHVTCGKTSNTNHYTVNNLCRQRMAWKGVRPHSGLFKKKDGYCGFKNRPPKPLKVFDVKQNDQESPKVFQSIHMLVD